MIEVEIKILLINVYIINNYNNIQILLSILLWKLETKNFNLNYTLISIYLGSFKVRIDCISDKTSNYQSTLNLM